MCKPCNGISKISLRLGTPTHDFEQNFPKNYIKLKEFEPQGVVPLAPLRFATVRVTGALINVWKYSDLLDPASSLTAGAGIKL